MTTPVPPVGGAIALGGARRRRSPHLPHRPRVAARPAGRWRHLGRGPCLAAPSSRRSSTARSPTTAPFGGARRTASASFGSRTTSPTATPLTARAASSTASTATAGSPVRSSTARALASWSATPVVASTHPTMSWSSAMAASGSPIRHTGSSPISRGTRHPRSRPVASSTASTPRPATSRS